jgi:hypothetical protein
MTRKGITWVLDDPVAALSGDGATVALRRGAWAHSFPVADLGGQLGFYRGLRDRAGGRYAWAYAPVVVALEGVESAAKARGVLA